MRLGTKTINDLLNFFKEIVESQKAIDAMKIQLKRINPLSSKLLFKSIAGSQQRISIKRMREFITPKLACNDRQLYDIFQKYDHQRSGFINLANFETQLIPFNPQCLKYSLLKPDLKTTQQKFIKLLSVTVRTTRVLDTWRKQLLITLPYLFFQVLDRSKTGVISPKNLFQFFYDNGQQLNHRDAHILHKSLLKRFHQSVNLEVFCQNLQPLEFGYYQAFKFYFEEEIKQNLGEKATQAREAVQVQENYLKQRRTQQIVNCIHQEAALIREKELEKRVQDEIRAYRQLKYMTRKKYNLHLSFEEFMIAQKENEERNILKIMHLAEEARLKEQIYKDRIRMVKAIGEVQKFKEEKKIICPKQQSKLGEQQTNRLINQRQLQKRIKSHHFSKIQSEDLLMKRRVQKEILLPKKLL